MKSCYVSDLKPDQAISTLFLVREKSIRTSARTGRSWLDLELADRTGAIAAKMWDNFEKITETFGRDDIVRVRGRVTLYNDKNELTLQEIIRAGTNDYDLNDFLPATPQDVEKLFAELQSTVAGIRNPWVKKLLESFLGDSTISRELKRAPAAMTMHHAYLGGLLEHIVSLCGLTKKVAAHYPELDVDLLLAACVLHDIGKTRELAYERAIAYTDEGHLLGHIVIGLHMVESKIEAIPGFPAPLATLLAHLIASHHGEYEFGSPKLPACREAVVFHYLDDLDSKLGAMRVTLETDAGEGDWTERNPSLRRQLLRVDRFLAGPAAKGSPPAASAAAKSAGGAPKK
ncbi:MAG: 3'-5' exoribonuclease YhaM family protein [Candidatus Acidiferrales bacterium]